MHIIVVNQLQLIVIITKFERKKTIKPTLLMKNKNAVKHSKTYFLFVL